LQEHDLPLPTADGMADSYLISPQFVESLMSVPKDEDIRRLIEERAALVRSACNWKGNSRSRDRRPRSRDQVAVVSAAGGSRIENAADFAGSLRGV
jgi:hypothetical protein